MKNAAKFALGAALLGGLLFALYRGTDKLLDHEWPKWVEVGPREDPPDGEYMHPAVFDWLKEMYLTPPFH